MSDLNELPSPVAVLTQWYRSQTLATELVAGSSIHSTKLPKLELRTYPLVLVRLIADPDRIRHIHHLVDALFQIDVWADTADEAWTIAERFRALASQRFRGRINMPAGSLVASAARAGGIHPETAKAASVDATTNAEREHARFDLTASLHP